MDTELRELDRQSKAGDPEATSKLLAHRERMGQNLIYWGKVKKARTSAEHSQISFDGGPPGGYVPNMSDEDARRWRGKHIKRGKNPRVEIRKQHGSNILIVVSLLGGFKQTWSNGKWQDTLERDGVNVRISANGGMEFSFQDWEDLKSVVEEATLVLQAEQ